MQEKWFDVKFSKAINNVKITKNQILEIPFLFYI